jgi:formylglycine-generating enzyme required for sulfatase activity/uncharacterized caspase-like protein
VGFPQFIAVTWLALICALAPAHAEKRVALVVGNDRYANLSAQEQLQKAVNDARAVSGALKQIGFDVISGENLGRQAMIDKIGEAAQRLAQGDTVFFFFAGHGVAVDGANYILPADVPDVEKGQITRLKGAAIAEEYVTTELMSAGARVAVVVLDACRDNPYGTGTRGVGGERGLAPREPPSGVFTLYSAGRGQAALDRLSNSDGNPNSVFTRVLVPALTRPGIDLAALAIGVREEVAQIAQTVGHPQRPAYYDETVGGQVYLAGLPPAKGGGVSPQPAGPAADEAAWSILKDTKDVEQLRRFIAQFPGSPQRRAAEERLRTLEQPAAGLQTAAVAPPVTHNPPSPPAKDQLALAIDPHRSGAAPLSAAQERGLKATDTFRECENCPEMVVVPAGSFTLGSPGGERGRDGNEGPQRDVTIGRQFAVGKFHVTVDQFAAFVRETRYAASSRCYKWAAGGGSGSWRDPGLAQEGSHPVVCVTFDDVKAYVNWLAKKTGKPYRLLSEAEFEYAARGQTSPGEYPRFWFGNDESDLCRNANGADLTEQTNLPAAKTTTIAPCDDGYTYTSPAGRYTPNAFGLFDMAGNAWQWTEDCWHESYNGAPSDGSAWTTTCDGNLRVVRGGSWRYSPKALRAAFRLKNADTTGYVDLGFRLARTLAY